MQRNYSHCAEHSRGQQDQRCDELQCTVNGDAKKTERQQNQPDDWI